MKSEQMQTRPIPIMSTFLLVSDGLVQRMEMEKDIIMKKMGTNPAGLCPVCPNPFKILAVQPPQHLNHLHLLLPTRHLQRIQNPTPPIQVHIINYRFLTTETNSKALYIFCCLFTTSSVKLFVVNVQIFVYHCVFRKKEKQHSPNLSHFENESTFWKRTTFWKLVYDYMLKMGRTTLHCGRYLSM